MDFFNRLQHAVFSSNRAEPTTAMSSSGAAVAGTNPQGIPPQVNENNSFEMETVASNREAFRPPTANMSFSSGRQAHLARRRSNLADIKRSNSIYQNSAWFKWSQQRRTSQIRRQQDTRETHGTRISSSVMKIRMKFARFQAPDEIRRERETKQKSGFSCNVFQYSKSTSIGQETFSRKLTTHQWKQLMEYWDHPWFHKFRIVGVVLAIVAFFMALVALLIPVWSFYTTEDGPGYAGLWWRCIYSGGCNSTMPAMEGVEWQQGTVAILVISLLITYFGVLLSWRAIHSAYLPKKVYFYHSSGEVFLFAGLGEAVGIMVYTGSVKSFLFYEHNTYGVALWLNMVSSILLFGSALFLHIDQLIRSSVRPRGFYIRLENRIRPALQRRQQKSDETSQQEISSPPPRPARKAKIDGTLRMEAIARALSPSSARKERVMDRFSPVNRSKHIQTPSGGNSASTLNLSARATAAKQKKLPPPPTAVVILQAENSLFTAIKSNQVAPQALVDDWITQYNSNRDAALLELMHFFSMSCGCQGAISKKLYEERKFVEIIQRITDAFDEDSYEYPLIQAGPVWRKFRISFNDFISILIQRCQFSVIYDAEIMDVLIAFLVALTDSQVRAFRHTATLVSMKMVTALVSVALNLGINRDNTQRQLDAERRKSLHKQAQDRLESLQLRQQELLSHLESVHNMILFIFKGVFVHRYRDTVAEIRTICIQELGAWMITYPSMLLDDTYLKYIGWTLFDRVAEVRLHCVRTLVVLFENGNLIQRMELFISRFKSRLLEMTLDCDMEVCVCVVKLFVSVVRFKSSLLDDEDCESIYELVYCTHRPLASAAGEFVALKLFQQDPYAPTVKTKSGKNRSPFVPMMRCFIQFFVESDLHSHLAYLVDSLWDHCPMLQDWECMSDLLLEEPGRGEAALRQLEEAALIETLDCCVRQAITGESPIGRQPASSHHGSTNVKLKEQKLLTEVKAKVSESLVTTLPKLFSRYGALKENVLNLLDIATHLNLELYSTMRQERALDQLLKCLQDCVVRNNHFPILLACSKVFENLCEESASKRDKCVAVRDTLLDAIAVSLKDGYAAVFGSASLENDEPNPDDEYALLATLKRVCAFYNCHDLSRLEMWTDLIHICEKANCDVILSSPVYSKIISKAFNCAQLHLLWEFYHFDENVDTDQKQMKELRRMLNHLMSLCRDCLDHSSLLVAEEAYYTLCDLLLAFSPHLMEANIALAPLVYEVDQDLQMSLEQYLQSHVFVQHEQIDEEALLNVTLKKRCQLSEYCKLVIYNVLPVSAAAIVFCEFVRFSADYGDIMKFTLGRLRDICRIETAKMLLKSLQIVFTKVENQSKGSVQRESEEFKAMKELARRMCLSFGLDTQKNRKAILTLHLVGIELCKQWKEPRYGKKKNKEDLAHKLLFFELISEFSCKLHPQDRKHLHDVLEKAFPDDSREFSSPISNYRSSLEHEKTEVSLRSHDITRSSLASPRPRVSKASRSTVTSRSSVSALSPAPAAATLNRTKRSSTKKKLPKTAPAAKRRRGNSSVSMGDKTLTETFEDLDETMEVSVVVPRKKRPLTAANV